MQGVIAPTVYAAIFVFSNGVAIFAGPLPPSTIPDAVASKKLVYFTVAGLGMISLVISTPHSYKNDFCKGANKCYE